MKPRLFLIVTTSAPIELAHASPSCGHNTDKLLDSLCKPAALLRACA
ncbi:hypothetical protein JHY03_72960 (plasmid) [Streptomyces sp. CA-256286]|nr:hypothetical protein JHY03_72560 [Streptomyces sp. CA-256286]QTA37080.1 hypothetical protein JHY03_72960 [Streptomyces sp. CA-256286]